MKFRDFKFALSQRITVLGIVVALLRELRVMDALTVLYCSRKWGAWRIPYSNHILKYGRFLPGSRVVHEQHAGSLWPGKVLEVSYNSKVPTALMLIDCDKFEEQVQMASLLPEVTP